jgi:hypothetical protein
MCFLGPLAKFSDCRSCVRWLMGGSVGGWVGRGSLPGVQADSISPHRRRSRLSSSGGGGGGAHHQGFIKDQCTDSNCIRRPSRKFLLQVRISDLSHSLLYLRAS